MVAMEIVTPEGKPDAAYTAAVKEKALEKNLLLLTCGSDHNVIRFIAPLIVTEREIDQAADILQEIF